MRSLLAALSAGLMCTLGCGTGGGAATRADAQGPHDLVGFPGPSPAMAGAPTLQPGDGAESDVALRPVSPLATKQTRVIADAPAPRVWRGRRVDIDVKGADVHDVCRLLADVGHVNIVVTDDVQGTVTLKMRAVPWEQALEVILRSKGLYETRDGDVILVSAKPL